MSDPNRIRRQQLLSRASGHLAQLIERRRDCARNVGKRDFSSEERGDGALVRPIKDCRRGSAGHSGRNAQAKPSFASASAVW